MKFIRFCILPLALITLLGCSQNRIVITEGEITNDMFYLPGEIKPFTGTCLIPYEDGKTVKELIHFHDGVSFGEALSYYKNGKLRRKGYYKSGKMHGQWEQWFENGEKEFEISFSNDSMSGHYKLWYETGQLKEEGALKNNSRIGAWKFYATSGNLACEKTYPASGHARLKSGQNLYKGPEPQVF
jgi:antitoxin component YwqK of YwqJK toxin-antitoxin module